MKAAKTIDFKYTSERGLRKIVEKVDDNWFLSTISFSDECRAPLDKCGWVKEELSPMEAEEVGAMFYDERICVC